ncbi:hypothetical protein [Corynebacterium belfantii]|uniref:hypothetical protein n=1 Tax=Corynebacterium belfantii TaxID=2014537 RepID=UPI0018D3F8D1|nr:hypothetical protein [Corynebacterium belfantii]
MISYESELTGSSINDVTHGSGAYKVEGTLIFLVLALIVGFVVMAVVLIAVLASAPLVLGGFLLVNMFIVWRKEGRSVTALPPASSALLCLSTPECSISPSFPQWWKETSPGLNWCLWPHSPPWSTSA